MTMNLTESCSIPEPAAVPITFRFGACIAYENDPDGDRGPLFFTYEWAVTSSDGDAAWEAALEAVRLKGLEHGARYSTCSDLSDLPFEELADALISIGIHMTPPTLLSADSTNP